MILVTGGAGYVGSVLVRRLLEEKYKVRVYDSLVFGDKSLQGLDVTIVQGDIRKFDPGVLEGIDAVIHLAALSNDPTADYDPKINLEINLLGTMRVAEACRKKGIKKFLHASSCSVYHSLPFDDRVWTEDDIVRPIGHYALSKYLAEEILLSLEDLAPVIFRQGTIYGVSPRMRYDLVVNTFVKDVYKDNEITIYNGGKKWRPLIDVNDVAEAYVFCLKNYSKVSGQVFNLSAKNYRVIDIAEIVRGQIGNNPKIINVDKKSMVRSYRVSTEKLEGLGFKPIHSVISSVSTLRNLLQQGKYADFDNPIYYNLKWLEKTENADSAENPLKD